MAYDVGESKAKCSARRVSSQIDFDGFIAMVRRNLHCNLIGFLEFEMVEIFRG